MKRSEMVNLIYETIYQHNKIPNMTMAEMANLILVAQERAGMQPPNIKLSQMFPKSECQVVEDNNYWYGCWEPENET